MCNPREKCAVRLNGLHMVFATAGVERAPVVGPADPPPPSPAQTLLPSRKADTQGTTREPNAAYRTPPVPCCAWRWTASPTPSPPGEPGVFSPPLHGRARKGPFAFASWDAFKPPAAAPRSRSCRRLCPAYRLAKRPHCLRRGSGWLQVPTSASWRWRVPP